MYIPEIQGKESPKSSLTQLLFRESWEEKLKCLHSQHPFHMELTCQLWLEASLQSLWKLSTTQRGMSKDEKKKILWVDNDFCVQYVKPTSTRGCCWEPGPLPVASKVQLLSVCTDSFWNLVQWSLSIIKRRSQWRKETPIFCNRVREQ